MVTVLSGSKSHLFGIVYSSEGRGKRCANYDPAVFTD